jgi:TetR/AcrR family transcriptional regulator
MLQPGPSAEGDTETRLLDAAEEVFAERGFRAASTSEIARRAKLNKTLIHYYFRSKEGLYQATMQRIARQMAPFLEDLAITDPVEAVVAATRRYVRLLADHPHYVRLCAYETLEGIETHGDMEMYDRLMQATSQAIRRGVDRGLFRAEDPRHVQASVLGMCRYFFEHEQSMRQQWGDDYERESIVEERAEHIVRFLLHGLGYQPPMTEPGGKA